MPANFNDNIIVNSNGSIKAGGGTGSNKQVLTSAGSGGSANWTSVVNDVKGGNGISVDKATGTVTITNTGVLSLSAGSNITLSGSTGNITISSSGGGGGGGGSSVNAIKAGTGITLSPSNGNLNNSDVTISASIYKVIGTDGIKVTPGNGNLTSNDITLTLDVDFCPKWAGQQITGNKLVAQGPGTGRQPAWVMNARAASTGWVGCKTNDGSRGFTFTSGPSYDEDSCGGSAGVDKETIFEIIPWSSTQNPRMLTKGMQEHSGDAFNVECYAQDGSSPVGLTSKDVFRFGFKRSIVRSAGQELITRATDSRVDLDIDSLIDQIGGFSDDPETPNGLFKWALKKLPADETVKYPYLFIDIDELRNKLPCAVDLTPTASAYDTPEEILDEDGEVAWTNERLRPDWDPNTELKAGSINPHILGGLTLAGLVRARKRLNDIEAAYASTTYVDNRFAELIDAAPISLNTLNELSAALGDDANFASTVTTQIGLKLDASAVSTFGLTLVDDADAAAARTTLGLGTAATANTDAFATAAQGAIAEAALPAAGASTAVGATALIALSGVPGGDTNLGGFTGSTITDNVTVKVAFQEVETAIEARALATTVTAIDTDVTALGALSGVTAGSTDLGTFTGSTITDNTTVKTALQEIETALEAAGATSAAPVLIEVHNASGGTLIKGTPVYVSGTHASGIPLVESADANGTSTYPVVGLIHTDLTTGNAGFVVISGLLNGLDTDSAGWNAGDALYLSETAGDLVTTRPTANGTKVQKVALVTRRDATAGSIVVMGAGRTNDVPNELTTLLGTTLNDSDLGTFTGSIVTDNTSVKTAIQELETEIETKVDLDGANIPGAYNNDTEAASNGVPVNGVYRNNNGTIHWRQS